MLTDQTTRIAFMDRFAGGNAAGRLGPRGIYYRETLDK
jgi:hypothetical protein